MKYFFLTLIFLILPITSFAKIKNYEKYIGITEDKEIKSIVLRKFSENHKIKYLAVNPSNLQTKIISGNVKKQSLKEIIKQFKNTKYIKLLKTSLNNKKPLQNAGIKKFKESKCIFITTDLCPSNKQMEYSFYKNISKYSNKPVPIGIAISGKWILKHKNELNLLLKLESANNISITWINHSYNHFYNKDLSLNKNFLLHKDTKLNSEILDLEKLLLENKLLPSVFFRFPGLISDETIFNKVTGYGLIVLGSNAWIAKGEKPGNGSIVLLHGNGNEHIGIEIFKKLLKMNKNFCFGKLGE